MERNYETIGLDITEDLFNGDLDAYYEWNIEGAARVIVHDAIRTTVYKPEESKLTLMIYEAHKMILGDSGYDPKKLELGDIKLVNKVKDRLSKKKQGCLN